MAHKRSKTKPKPKVPKTGTSASTLPSRGEASPEGFCTMNSEPFHPDAQQDVSTDAAVIHPVTPAVLDAVAHKAAQLADEVAHHPGHGASAHPAAQDTPADAAPAATSQHGMVETAADAAEGARRLSDTVIETARDGMTEAQQAATNAVETAGAAIAQSDAVLAEAAEGAGEVATQAVAAVSDPASDAERRLSGAGDAIGRYNAAVLGMIRVNMAATGEFFAALVKAKSVPEAVAINADHLRRQFDTLTTQGRELTQLAQALAFDTMTPPAGNPRRDG